MAPDRVSGHRADRGVACCLALRCAKLWKEWDQPFRRLGVWAARRAGLPSEVHDDFAQELIGHLFEQRGTIFGRFDGRSRLLTYLRPYALILAGQRAERRKLRLAMERPAAPETLLCLPTGSLGPLKTAVDEDPVEAHEKPDWEAARRYVETLPPRQRTVVTLRFRDGLTWAEIGDRLEITARAARTAFFDAIHTLEARRRRGR